MSDRSGYPCSSESIARAALAKTLLSSTDVWDMTLPWVPEFQDTGILQRYRQSGFTFVSATIEDFPPTLDGVRECIRAFKTAASVSAPWLAFTHSLQEVDQARRDRKLAMGFNVQDTVQLGNDKSRIEMLYALGVRHMILAYQTRNFVADGCAEASDAGLSNFGREVVREMNRVGMIVDCTHTGRRSSLEAINLSELPVIFSHSNAYALCPHIRNIRDEQIRACAARGGVVGIVGIGAFLGDPLAQTETAFRHIDYIATLVGTSHVGLGTDFVKDMSLVWESMMADKAVGWPDPTGTQLYEGECFQPEQLSELVEVMLEHGYTSADVKGILGANFRRVYEEAEAVAAHRKSDE